MTTSTTAEVGHASKDQTVVKIDGFRGRLISADWPCNLQLTGGSLTEARGRRAGPASSSARGCACALHIKSGYDRHLH